MKALIAAYGAAVAARVAADREPDPCGARMRTKAAEAIALDAVEDALHEITRRVSDCVSLADDVRTDKRILRGDDVTLQSASSKANHRVGVDRYRKPTLKDAKRNAEYTARLLRQAWESLDPSLATEKSASAAYGVVARKCLHCGHNQTVTPAAVQPEPDGSVQRWFGSRHDHCDLCDGPTTSTEA